MVTNMENTPLLRLLAQKDEQALRRAIIEYAPVAKAVISRILPKHPQDTEECVSDVFLSLWKNAPSLDAQSISLKGWIIVVSRNTAVNRYRRLKRKKEIPLREEIAPELLTLEGLDSDFNKLQALLVSMNECDREIFIRKYYFLESAAEIGNKLRLSEDAVNQRLSRGRKQLKQRFSEELSQ